MKSHSYGITLLLFLIFLLPCCKKGKSPKELLYVQFHDDLNTLIFRNEQFLGQARKIENNAELQSEFLKLRLRYKKVEAFSDYFFPTTVRLVNGAPLDEVEDEENAVFEPGGLQVIEELIYTTGTLERDELVRHVRKLNVNLMRIKKLWVDIQVTDSHIPDALRLELFRLITLGISGFDSPASGNAVQESQPQPFSAVAACIQDKYDPECFQNSALYA